MIESIVARDPKISVPRLTLFLNSTSPTEFPICPQGSSKDISHVIRRAQTSVFRKWRGTGPKSTVYAGLPHFKVYLEYLDPDTRFQFHVRDGFYDRCTIVPGSLIRANKVPGLKPVVSLDAATPKPLGEMGVEGKLYIATMVDGASKTHVAAIGHDGNESEESWYHFLSLLQASMRVATAHPEMADEGLSTRARTAFLKQKFSYIMDEHSGSKAAMEKLELQDLYSLCIKHKAGNVARIFGEDAKKNFYKLAKIGEREKGENMFHAMKSIGPKSKSRSELTKNLNKYVANVASKVLLFELHTKGIFRYGMCSSSSTECLNSTPGVNGSPFGGYLRFNHPIFAVLQYYIWNYARLKHFNDPFTREKLGRRKLGKGAIDHLRKHTEPASKMKDLVVSRSGNQGYSFQVEDTESSTIYKGSLRTHKCTCGLFQELQLPCKHAMCAIGKDSQGRWKVLRDDGFDAEYFDKIWLTENILKMNETALGGRRVPKLEVIIDIANNNGRISDEGLKLVADQLNISAENFQNFKSDWNKKVEQAAKEAGIPDDLIFSDQPMIKNPSHENCNKKTSDGAKISCKFCDAKIKSNHASKRGRKRVARIRSDTDLG